MAPEPWLEGLSEEWNSLPPSSSPLCLPQQSRSNISRKISLDDTESRIPHLAHSMRKSSNLNGSYLKPRSQRGIAKQQAGALREVSASNLNATTSQQSRQSRSEKASTVPRRVSSALSGSQSSVQHHTLHESSRAEHDAPQWRRRLNEGADLTSDGFDLFSPSKLEGIFKQSSCPAEPEGQENSELSTANDLRVKPWTELGRSAFPAPATNPYRSYRTQRGGKPDMEILQEEDENENAIDDLSAISSDLIREGSIRGLVKRRVSNLENSQLPEHKQYVAQDPRYRTISGRKEVEDELISPVTLSTQNTIRTQVMQTLENNPKELKEKLKEALLHNTRPPRLRSRSSDHDISYEGKGSKEESMLHEQSLEEMTSLSLPEDLSMGTQNYIPSTFVNTKRGPASGESSFMRRGLSSMPESSQLSGYRDFRSSPPPYRSTEEDSGEESELDLNNRQESAETSVVHHEATSAPVSKTASPLKLFGPRDTFTNNKLMRILSHYEEDTTKEPSQLECMPSVEPMRMSNFGEGELDKFDFDQEVERPRTLEQDSTNVVAGIFAKYEQPALNDHLPSSTPASRIPRPQERSPKRRRTLVKDEVAVDDLRVEVKVAKLPENTLAGRKRKDARPGMETEQASPETLAQRQLLRPSGSWRPSSSGHSRSQSTAATETTVLPIAPLAEALAAELESFTKTATAVHQDSRKASLATKDYMEEANKVMEFIRARGKPKTVLPEIREPEDLSEIANQLLDSDLDESTKDSFSRPPSREGYIKPWEDKRQTKHDPQIASHLQKFKESDDLELLASISVVSTIQLVDNNAVKEAAQIPIPEDDLLEVVNASSHERQIVDTEETMNESNPPGMRILNDNDRKRKHSGTTDGQPDSIDVDGDGDGDRRTIQTSSSTSSRGMITSGTVSIPDAVGAMIFDKEKNVWVKQKSKETPLPLPVSVVSIPREIVKSGRQEMSEADPFDDIPDLSIDEIEEEKLRKVPASVNKGNLASADVEHVQSERGQPKGIVSAIESSAKPSAPLKSSLRSEAARHEERLHSGLPSVDVALDDRVRQQPRVVTIAFSTPLASEIPYNEPPSMSDIDDDDPSMLPIDEEGSLFGSSPVRHTEQHTEVVPSIRRSSFMGSQERHDHYRAMTLNRRPVSRIQEHDEDREEVVNDNDDHEMSLVCITQNYEVTPLPERHLTVMKGPETKQNSILCLTPLSEFTLHQIDRANHPEESFVGTRVNSKSLRQAHGSHALIEDALVKAITDAAPRELYWEQLRHLVLQDSHLTSLHGLKDYCSSLESLDVVKNCISQLTDLPVSLRSLNVSANRVNDLTSWTHLHNLQVIDVSDNSLESLEAFGSLVHLRKLRARNNNISGMEGIFDLDGLTVLDLSENRITEVDFSTCELLSLEDLDLSMNGLSCIKNLHYLTALKKLDLHGNLLEQFYQNTEYALNTVEDLDLSCNKLATFDLHTLPVLRTLTLDHNHLTQIAGLSSAHNLVTLSVRSQQVRSNLVNEILSVSNDLSELYVSCNALPLDTGLLLPRLPNYSLRHLEAACCGISQLQPSLGDHLPNLRSLNLNFNAISDLTPLIGAVKLRDLTLMRNRVKKMRRTCLTLARFEHLERVDLRDNPLEIGFYSPEQHANKVEMNKETLGRTSAFHQLPDRAEETDKRWVDLLDETTWLRRRAMELLLTGCCPTLTHLDGGVFDRESILRERKTFDKLMGKGILQISPCKGPETT